MTEPVCPHCGGSGWKIVERDGVSGAERCDCRDAERAALAESRAGIPPLYRHASFESFRLPQDNPLASHSLSYVRNIVSSYASDFPIGVKPGLLLMGEAGTGKTHLAVAALRTLISRGFEGVFMDFQTLLNRIRASYDKTSGSSDREALRMALDAPVLVLDDLGAHRVKEFVQDTVAEIITHRCNHQMPVIATTNLIDDDVPGSGGGATKSDAGPDREYAKPKLDERIGFRARSRLFELCRIVRMPSVEDHRVANRKVY